MSKGWLSKMFQNQHIDIKSYWSRGPRELWKVLDFFFPSLFKGVKLDIACVEANLGLGDGQKKGGFPFWWHNCKTRENPQGWSWDLLQPSALGKIWFEQKHGSEVTNTNQWHCFTQCTSFPCQTYFFLNGILIRKDKWKDLKGKIKHLAWKVLKSHYSVSSITFLFPPHPLIYLRVPFLCLFQRSQRLSVKSCELSKSCSGTPTL